MWDDSNREDLFIDIVREYDIDYGEEIVNDRVNSCRICNKIYKNKRNLLRHFDIKHLNEYHYLCWCGVGFRTKRNLVIHNSIYHKHGMKYQCDICNLKCKDRVSLNNHIRNTHPKSKYKCDLCDKSFTRNTSLKRHKKDIHLREPTAL